MDRFAACFTDARKAEAIAHKVRTLVEQLRRAMRTYGTIPTPQSDAWIGRLPGVSLGHTSGGARQDQGPSHRTTEP